VLSEKAHSFRHRTDVTNAEYFEYKIVLFTCINGSLKFQKQFSVNSHATAVTNCSIPPLFRKFMADLTITLQKIDINV
jgi:hypothetical protein